MSTEIQLKPAFPDHVQPELVWDHSYLAFTEKGEDPFLTASALHQGPDIIWAADIGFGEPGWIPTRYEHIREVFADADLFPSKDSMSAVLDVDWKLIPLELNPPEHHAYRKILEPLFTPSAVDSLDGSVVRVCNELIAGFEEDDGCEFACDFGEKFPSYIFLDLMGMPKEMLPDFLTWERGMIREQDPVKRLASMNTVLHYLEQFVGEQRKNPQTDLLKAMFAARFNDERPLSNGEIISMCYVMYIGGLDTVFSTLGWILRHLAGDPELQEQLVQHPDQVIPATDEFLRLYSAASSQRLVGRDCEFHGVQMRAGDSILLSLPLAARDPRAYDHPHRFDLDRRVRHLAFGTGSHTCLGLRLAKREIRAVLNGFLSRFRNIRIPHGEHYEFHSGAVFGVDRLPLEWERR